jgi:arylsulfatase A-like enzyme
MGKVGKLTLIVCMVGVFLFFIICLYNRERIDMVPFNKSVRRLLQRSDELCKKAPTYNEKELLKRLGRNRINGFYYRLDDHLHEAIAEYTETSQQDAHGLSPYGTRYKRKNGIMRKVIYLVTPQTLTYRVDIPAGTTFLKFGLAISDGDDPVAFAVSVTGSDGEQNRIFTKEVTNADAWHDVRIEVSQWTGNDVEISLGATSKKGNIAFWSNPIIYTPPKKTFNVIVILEDSLRADYMSCYGYHLPTTPVRDDFANSGVLFLNAFSQATETPQSCPTLMTSLYPSALGLWGKVARLDQNYLTLAEIMRNQGFATGTFTQNINAVHLSGLLQGFGTWHHFDISEFRAEHMYGEKVRRWIEANKERNFFLYLHLIDPHKPYDPPKPYDSWYRERPGTTPVARDEDIDPEWVAEPTVEGRRLLYSGEVRYNDRCFEDFLATLNDYGLLDTTLIIVSADHGENLGEHGAWGHSPPGYIQGLHVPLIMVYPERLPKGMRVTQLVQLIDVMPTILDLAHIPKGKLLLQGDSLLPLIAGKKRHWWHERIIVSEQYINRDNVKKGAAWASLFYKQWHMLNSYYLAANQSDRLARLMRYKGLRGLHNRFFSMRVFDYNKDKEEHRYLRSFLIDLPLRHRIANVINRLQKNNLKIGEAVTQGRVIETKYGTEEVEELRALGYLQ